MWLTMPTPTSMGGTSDPSDRESRWLAAPTWQGVSQRSPISARNVMTTIRDHRLWLLDVPAPEDRDEEYSETYSYLWGSELDEAISVLRAQIPLIDNALKTAEAGGIALLPVYYGPTPSTSEVCPFEALSRNGGDEDWVVIATGNGPNHSDQSHEDYLAEVVAERLAPCKVETHITPTWVIRLTCHA